MQGSRHNGSPSIFLCWRGSAWPPELRIPVWGSQMFEDDMTVISNGEGNISLGPITVLEYI